MGIQSSSVPRTNGGMLRQGTQSYAILIFQSHFSKLLRSGSWVVIAQLSQGLRGSIYIDSFKVEKDDSRSGSKHGEQTQINHDEPNLSSHRVAQF